MYLKEVQKTDYHVNCLQTTRAESQEKHYKNQGI